MGVVSKAYAGIPYALSRELAGKFTGFAGKPPQTSGN